MEHDVDEVKGGRTASDMQNDRPDENWKRPKKLRRHLTDIPRRRMLKEDEIVREQPDMERGQ
jgi:hypothetical protein